MPHFKPRASRVDMSRYVVLSLGIFSPARQEHNGPLGDALNRRVPFPLPLALGQLSS